MAENSRKRQASTQQGAIRKDTRINVRDDTLNQRPINPTSTSNSFEILNHPKSYADITMRRSSISSQGSSRRGRVTNMGERSLFVTPRPERGLRDDLIIQCQTINDKPFKGTITFKEAKFAIFEGKLGYEHSLLHSIRMSFNGCPVIKFKLNSQVDIDDLIGVEHFDFERSYPFGNGTKTDVIHCRVMGIRAMQSVAQLDPENAENNVRWVKIEGCEYTLENHQIMDWLEIYGEPISPICEDIHEDSDSEAEPIGNGTYSVKMKLNKDIPQFLPMHGRRIRIYYKGITKLCTKCFGTHSRRQCQSEKVPWIVYVRNYMSNNESIEESLYGKWWEIIDKEFPNYFDLHEDESPQARDQSDDSVPAIVSEAVGSSGPTNLSEQEIDQANRPRLSRDPRVRKQQLSSNPQLHSNKINNQQDLVEISGLMARGLTLEDARSYHKNKIEQAAIEKRMSETSTKPTQFPTRGRGKGTRTTKP